MSEARLGKSKRICRRSSSKSRRTSPRGIPVFSYPHGFLYTGEVICISSRINSDLFPVVQLEGSPGFRKPGFSIRLRRLSKQMLEQCRRDKTPLDCAILLLDKICVSTHQRDLGAVVRVDVLDEKY
jgi:hypothetical protein